MSTITTIATIFGLALGLAAGLGGWGAFLLVLVFGALGVFVGRVLEGAVDLTPYLGGRDRARR